MSTQSSISSNNAASLEIFMVMAERVPATHTITHTPATLTTAPALKKLLTRLRTLNDTVTFRTTGGLRVMIRNDPNDSTETTFGFDVSVVTSNEPTAVERSLRNEIDIEDDVSGGVIIVDEYEFEDTDDDALDAAVAFLNVLDTWRVCPCGDFLIKDRGSMCYYCELVADLSAPSTDLCPICHEDIGNARSKTTTPCCTQPMHRSCREACIAAAEKRNGFASCPMCRKKW